MTRVVAVDRLRAVPWQLRCRPAPAGKWSSGETQRRTMVNNKTEQFGRKRNETETRKTKKQKRLAETNDGVFSFY